MAVTTKPGWDQGGEKVDEFQRGEGACAAATAPGSGQLVNHLVDVDLFEPFEEERRARAVAQQPFQSGLIRRGDTHRSIT